MTLEREVKDAKMSSFWPYFQTLFKHKFPSYFLYGLLMSSRNNNIIITCVLLLNIVDVNVGAESDYGHSTQTTPNK